jgi:hypothetical protein
VKLYVCVGRRSQRVVGAERVTTTSDTRSRVQVQEASGAVFQAKESNLPVLIAAPRRSLSLVCVFRRRRVCYVKILHYGTCNLRHKRLSRINFNSVCVFLLNENGAAAH